MEQEDYDELEELVEHLRRSGRPVIVEGPKDAAALRELGLRHIVTLSKRPLFAVVERIAAEHATCAVLTDLDAEGKKLYARLAKDLQKHGVAVDDRLRRLLFTRTELRQIEGLPRYLARWRQAKAASFIKRPRRGDGS